MRARQEQKKGKDDVVLYDGCGMSRNTDHKSRRKSLLREVCTPETILAPASARGGVDGLGWHLGGQVTNKLSPPRTSIRGRERAQQREAREK